MLSNYANSHLANSMNNNFSLVNNLAYSKMSDECKGVQGTNILNYTVKNRK